MRSSTAAGLFCLIAFASWISRSPAQDTAHAQGRMSLHMHGDNVLSKQAGLLACAKDVHLPQGSTSQGTLIMYICHCPVVLDVILCSPASASAGIPCRSSAMGRAATTCMASFAPTSCFPSSESS